MKKKQYELLHFLSESKRSMTSIELAHHLQISTRSVKNYVSDINKLYNKKIIKSSRNGYVLNRHVSIDLLLNKKDEMLPQTSEERTFYILKQLILEHTSSLNIYDLCEELCVSYSTIKSVISKMNITFSSYNVKFICEKNSVRINGTEKNIRKLISFIIYEDSKRSYVDSQQLKESFPNIDVDLLVSIIQNCFRKYSYYLNDFAFINILLHFLIIIERSMSGNYLKSNVGILEFQDENEKIFINDLCFQIESQFEVTLKQLERSEIYMIFKANANYSIPPNQETLILNVGEEIFKLSNHYIDMVNNHYLIDLSSKEFLVPFALHLKNLVFRAKFGRYTNNPLAETIKLNNPIVFDIAIYISLDLMERYKASLTEDEMAFLAIHIGAEIERQNQNKAKVPVVFLCPQYLNLGQNLINTLLLNFGHQINILQNVHTEDEINNRKFKILFTTVPLKYKYDDIIVCHISPFNIENEFETIQEHLTKAQSLYKNYMLRTNFDHFFEEDLFIANPNMNNKNQVITYLCDMLQVKHYVESSYEAEVFKRENAATTSFGKIAIPHSVEMNAIKTSIAVAISKEGITWDNNTVHLVLLLAINKADKRAFRELYESLITIFSNDIIQYEISDITDFQDFKSLVYVHANDDNKK